MPDIQAVPVTTISSIHRGSNWRWAFHKISLLVNKQWSLDSNPIFWFQIPRDFHGILCHPSALMEVVSKCKGTVDGGTMGLQGQIRSKCLGGVSLRPSTHIRWLQLWAQILQSTDHPHPCLFILLCFTLGWTHDFWTGLEWGSMPHLTGQDQRNQHL